jgi:hypothetical protein
MKTDLINTVLSSCPECFVTEGESSVTLISREGNFTADKRGRRPVKALYGAVEAYYRFIALKAVARIQELQELQET